MEQLLFFAAGCLRHKELINDIESLPEDTRLMIKAMVKAAAKFYHQEAP